MRHVPEAPLYSRSPGADIAAPGSWLALVHALRTPMTSLKGAIELLDAGVLGPVPDPLRPLLDIAQRNTNRLGHIIEELLLLRDLDAGRIALRLRPVDFNTLLRGAIADCHAAAHTSLSDMAPAAVVRADAAWLSRALRHVLPCAGAGLARHPSTRIELRRGTGEVQLTCIGTAIADSLTTGQQGEHAADLGAGTAIGIGIARHIVAAHGGQLDTSIGHARRVIVAITLPEELAPATFALPDMSANN